MTAIASDDIHRRLPGVPHQRTAALMNVYIANTTETLNQLSVVCERKVHDVDRRYTSLCNNEGDIYFTNRCPGVHRRGVAEGVTRLVWVWH